MQPAGHNVMISQVSKESDLENPTVGLVTMPKKRPLLQTSRSAKEIAVVPSLSSYSAKIRTDKKLVSISGEGLRSPSPHEKALGTLKSLVTRCTKNQMHDRVPQSSYERSVASFTSRLQDLTYRSYGKSTGNRTLMTGGLGDHETKKRTMQSMQDRISFFDGGKLSISNA
jgi:hypothetical protein